MLNFKNKVVPTPPLQNYLKYISLWKNNIKGFPPLDRRGQEGCLFRNNGVFNPLPSPLPQRGNVLGFTLAEVLITLVIIGVIAAITVPTVMNNVREQQYKTSFKKAYQVASEAWKRAAYDNLGQYTEKGGWSGCNWPSGETGDVNARDGRAEAFKKQMKVIKTCVNDDGCWPKEYERYGVIPDQENLLAQRYSWVTVDGICWSAWAIGFDDAHISVDTNCEKGPNLIGKDIFSFLLGVDGIVYFAIDNKNEQDNALKRGKVCIGYGAPVNINGRKVDFKDYLKK